MDNASISAHYDTIWKEPEGYAYASKEQPGADDNAVGVAAMLEIARVLSTMDLDTTIKFIAFSGEEQIFQGSESYVNYVGTERHRITGVINLDMFGYRGQNELTLAWKDFSHTERDIFMKNTAEDIATKHLGLNLIDGGAIERSDHRSFWEGLDYFEGSQAKKGIAAIAILPRFDEDDRVLSPNYHSSADTIKDVDLSYASRISRLAGIVVWRMEEYF